ncbi:MAG TPA: hypothetical protein VF589_07960 [Allosphingosinicella sp.]|jgi:hypothetical protein
MIMTQARGRMAALALIALSFGAAASPVQARQSDAQIRQSIIRQSIANYSGNCPCPYNTMRNGRRCGGNSAYSRPGGESPKCFADDVSQSEVNAYRRR